MNIGLPKALLQYVGCCLSLLLCSNGCVFVVVVVVVVFKWLCICCPFVCFRGLLFCFDGSTHEGVDEL